jgi:tetratricopeptide (TPR) repeat protein
MFMKSSSILIFFIILQLKSQAQEPSANIPLLFIQLQQNISDTQRINIFIKLGYYYIAPRRIHNRMDSVAWYLKKAENLNKVLQLPTLQNKIDLLAARYHAIFFNSEDARTLFFPIIDKCQNTGDKSTEAQAWFWLAYGIEQDPATYIFILNCCQNGLALARQTGDTNLACRIQLYISLIHILQRKFVEAETELQLILKQGKKVSAANLMSSYDRLSLLYLSKGEINKSLAYALKTQEMMGLTGDSTSAYFFLRRMTYIYRTLGKEAEYLIWTKRLLDFELTAIDIPGIYNNIVDLTNLMREEGRQDEVLNFILSKIAHKKPKGINDQRKVQQALGNAYLDKKKYDQAEKCYLEMIRLGNLQKHNFPISERAQDNQIIGQFYYSIGRYSDARPFLEICLNLYSILPFKRVEHQMLFKIDSALGNYIEAIRHLQEAERIGDSIFKAERTKQIEQLQIVYQSEQKDKNIRLLNEKEKLTLLQLKTTQTNRNWIIAGAFMLLIIAGLLYRQTRLRKRNSVIIGDKNKQLQHLVSEKE